MVAQPELDVLHQVGAPKRLRVVEESVGRHVVPDLAGDGRLPRGPCPGLGHKGFAQSAEPRQVRLVVTQQIVPHPVKIGVGASRQDRVLRGVGPVTAQLDPHVLLGLVDLVPPVKAVDELIHAQRDQHAEHDHQDLAQELAPAVDRMGLVMNFHRFGPHGFLRSSRTGWLTGRTFVELVFRHGAPHRRMAGLRETSNIQGFPIRAG